LTGQSFSSAETQLSPAAAAAEGNPSVVAIALDAGRGEVYVGEFTVGEARVSVAREYISKLDAFAADVLSRRVRVLSPDAKIVQALLASGAPAQQVDPVLADGIGRLGFSKFLAGELSDVATLDANYIRRSDAELFSTPKY
jgi:tRNA threonylcarbamoyladenosine biosynthesis protein TsaB